MWENMVGVHKKLFKILDITLPFGGLWLTATEKNEYRWREEGGSAGVSERERERLLVQEELKFKSALCLLAHIALTFTRQLSACLQSVDRFDLPGAHLSVCLVNRYNSWQRVSKYTSRKPIRLFTLLFIYAPRWSWIVYIEKPRSFFKLWGDAGGMFRSVGWVKTPGCAVWRNEEVGLFLFLAENR